MFTIDNAIELCDNAIERCREMFKFSERCFNDGQYRRRKREEWYDNMLEVLSDYSKNWGVNEDGATEYAYEMYIQYKDLRDAGVPLEDILA